MERKYIKYYQIYKSAGDERGSIFNEIYKFTTKNVVLQEKIENADGLIEAVYRKTEQLNAVFISLADKNVFLQ
jgi:hypothetical protein